MFRKAVELCLIRFITICTPTLEISGILVVYQWCIHGMLEGGRLLVQIIFLQLHFVHLC